MTQINNEVTSRQDQFDLPQTMSILSPRINAQTQTFHATLAALGQIPPNAKGHVDASSPQLDEAIEKWRKIVAAIEPQQWTRRLAWDGLNEHSARMALSDAWQAKGE